MLEQLHDMYLGIITIQNLKEESWKNNIASHLWRLFTNSESFNSTAEKNLLYPTFREALLGGGLYHCPRLNFQPFQVTISEGSHVTVGILSSDLSFLVISAPSCRRFRAVSPVGINPNRASSDASVTRKPATQKKKYRKSDPIHCLAVMELARPIFANSLCPRYLCYMYCTKHMYEIFKQYTKSFVLVWLIGW